MKRIQRRIDGDKPLSDVPKVQRRPVAKALAEYERLAESRNSAIVAAYASGGYTLKEIGEYFGLHYSRVSRIVAKAERKT